MLVLQLHFVHFCDPEENPESQLILTQLDSTVFLRMVSTDRTFRNPWPRSH
jgi:hypothetical protein